MAGYLRFHRSRRHINTQNTIIPIKHSALIVLKGALLLLVSLLLFYGCFRIRKGKALTQFKKFEYTYKNQYRQEHFSFLFTESDSFYFKKYDRQGDSLYVSILPIEQRFQINNFLTGFDTLLTHVDYQPNSDQGIFGIFLDFGNETQETTFPRIHGSEAFTSFNNWLKTIKDSLRFTLIKNEIPFHFEKK